MPARYVTRLACWILACTLPIGLGSVVGPAGILVGVALAVIATLWLAIWLPRTAHTAFEQGRYARAARRYRAIRALAFSATRERMALLSHAGCLVSSGKLADAEALHSTIDATTLAHAERAVWLNNRAFA